MEVTFKVYRKDPEKDGKPGRSNYTVEVPDGATVLEALFKIRDEMDSSLAFRCSCLRGHCGDCMVRVNGSSRLTCTAKVSAYTQKGPEISLDPLHDLCVAARRTAAAQRAGPQGSGFRLGRLHVE